MTERRSKEMIVGEVGEFGSGEVASVCHKFVAKGANLGALR